MLAWAPSAAVPMTEHRGKRQKIGVNARSIRGGGWGRTEKQSAKHGHSGIGLPSNLVSSLCGHHRVKNDAGDRDILRHASS